MIMDPVQRLSRLIMEDQREEMYKLLAALNIELK